MQGDPIARLALSDYRVLDTERILTPALAVYPGPVDANIGTTLRLLDDRPDRWRPHVKTSKLAFTLNRLLDHGIRRFKCATSLELVVACEAGVDDVLVAHPAVGANARRVRELAELFPGSAVSSLVDSPEQVAGWRGSRVGLFVDVNPGMNRTGLEQDRVGEIVALASAVRDAGLRLRGIHYYDGHLADAELDERRAEAHAGYDRLMEIVSAVESSGTQVEEVVTAGTPAFPCSLTYPPFDGASFRHRVSPGTLVYNDTTSLRQLPCEWSYRPAALVLTRVVSRPAPGTITCDAGHKTVSADAGVPTCAVLGHPALEPGTPSEEHLPVRVPEGVPAPAIGEVLYLIPRHVCPTVNSFDHALMVSNGRIIGVERVTARGREAPLV